MQAVETKVEYQNQKLIAQEKTIDAYRERVRELEITVAKLQGRKDPQCKEETSAIQDVTDDIKDFNENNLNTDEEKNTNRPELSIHSTAGKEGVKHRRMLVSGEGPVAFHAVIKENKEVSHIGLNQRIVFPEFKVNLGGGFHDQHGVFIAPQNGIYIFSTSIMSFVVPHPEISVDGDSGRHDQGSVTVVTQLAEGDEVWVSLYGPADTSVWGDRYDSFMGCLVFPL